MTHIDMGRSKMKEQIKAISLFSGLGGIDIGLHKAGIETVACVEKDSVAAETLKINSKKHSTQPDHRHIIPSEKYPWKVINQDIRKTDAERILEKCGSTREEIDLVVGGPPCQTFSRSNEGTRSGTDAEQGRLYQEYARILHQIEPEAFVFENVRGLESANNGEDLDRIRGELEQSTYQTEYKVLNAANFGVPQTRKRILIVGTKPDTEFNFPQPTHTENGDSETNEWVSAGQALSEFDTDQTIEKKGGYQNAIGSKYGTLLNDIPEGANYQHFSERKYDEDRGKYIERTGEELEEKKFDWRSRHWNYLLKLDQERPSWTLQAAPGTTVGPFHWRARKPSKLEQMRLMTIPLDYYIAGTPGKIQEQIGNAVPPKLIEAVAGQLTNSLELPTTNPSNSKQSSEAEPGKATDFTIEVSKKKSPWIYADRILNTVKSETAVVVRATQQAIPYAIDAIEIADRQIELDLKINTTENTIQNDTGKTEISSQLEAEILSEKTKLKLTA